MAVARFDDLLVDDDATVTGILFTVRSTQTGSATDGDIVIAGANALRFAHPTTSTNATYTYAKVASSVVTFGDTTWETAINANSTVTVNANLVVDQAAFDDDIFSGRSSDVAHGVTDVASTTTFIAIRKNSATAGGASFFGLSEGNEPMRITGIATTADATRTTGAVGAVVLQGSLKSGTGIASLGADKNICVIRDNATARFILDSDGDSHQDVGTAWTNFDTHDDIALLNLLSAHVTRPNDPLRANFAAFLEEGRDELERVRLVQFNDDGHHFVNMSRLAMLNTGAIRQLGRSLNAVINAVRENNPALLPAGA